MRVLMISKACIVGIYQRKLEAIARRGVDLLVLVPPSWRDERGEIKLERVYTEGYRLEVLPMRLNGNFHLHFYIGLGKRIRDFKPDIVHIDEEPYNLAAWQAMYRARQVGAKALFFSWQNLKRDYPFPFNQGERWMLKNVQDAIVGTESAGKVWREKGYSGRLAVIPQFGTDPDLFAPLSSSPERPFTIGYIGRLVEEKGVHLLLNAVSHLAGDWRLRILGSGPEQPRLQAQVEHLGLEKRVQFDAWIPSTEIPAYHHTLDVLVLPSLSRPNWKEQFGRVLIEAMSSGVPVIGSDSGAIPGVIGNAGLIFPEGEADKLLVRLEELCQDRLLREKLKAAGRARVLERFTHERVAEATVRVYRVMLSKD